MLQTMRDLSKSWLFKGLMVLLVTSFGIWGIGDMFRGNPQQRTVASIGKEKITVQALEHDFQISLPEARKTLGADLSTANARKLGVLDNSLRLMIEQSLFNQEAKRLGINVEDKLILDKLGALAQFRDKDGKFDSQQWKLALGKIGMTERGFIEIEKQNIARRAIFETITSNTKYPKYLQDSVYNARGAKRVLEIVTLKNNSIKDIPSPDETALKEYFEKHNDGFIAPEYRSLTIASMSINDIGKDSTVSDEDLRKAYDDRSDELTVPEQRDLVQVVLQDETKAKEFSGAAKASNNLPSTAKTKGINLMELNRVDEKNVLPELYTTIFSMEEGQISDPIKSPLGWQVVQLKKIYPSGKPSFEEAKAGLLTTLEREKSTDIIASTVNKLDDELAAGHALEDIADTLKLRIEKIPAIDVTGKTADGKEVEEIKAKNDVINAAFNLNAGETSQIIEDKSGNYLVVRTDEIITSQVRSFDAVKDKIAEAWKSDERTKKAQEEAENISKTLKEGKKASVFAAREGLEVRFSKPFSLLGETDPQIPSTSLNEIFQMKLGDVITSSDASNQYIMRLAEIVQVDPKKPDSALSKVIEDLNDKFPLELLDQYSKFLRENFPVKINKELLDSMKNQEG